MGKPWCWGSAASLRKIICILTGTLDSASTKLSARYVSAQTSEASKPFVCQMSSFTHQVGRVMPANGNGGRYLYTEGETDHRGSITLGTFVVAQCDMRHNSLDTL